MWNLRGLIAPSGWIKWSNHVRRRFNLILQSAALLSVSDERMRVMTVWGWIFDRTTARGRYLYAAYVHTIAHDHLLITIPSIINKHAYHDAFLSQYISINSINSGRTRLLFRCFSCSLLHIVNEIPFIFYFWYSISTTFLYIWHKKYYLSVY